jgi:nitrilase
MMAAKEAPFTVASVQATPVFMDRDRTIDKACTLAAEAAKQGAKIIVFPEAFVPAYPDWIWVLAPAQAALHRELYGELLDQSVAVPSAATEKLGKAAKAAGAYVVIGVNERNVEASGATLYNTLLYFAPDGSPLGKHRKLMPTSAERLVWAAGAGDTLEVYDTPYGKLGGLICWENYMPLARYAMYAWGTQIYVAATWDCADTWVATLQHIAKEGRVLVIGCCIAMQRKDIPDRYEFKKLYGEGGDEAWVNVGNSAIVDPDGHIIAGPAVETQEILYAEIEPRKLREPRYWFDAAGHYGRPDVFQLTVNREAHPMISTMGAANGWGAKDGRHGARSRAPRAG